MTFPRGNPGDESTASTGEPQGAGASRADPPTMTLVKDRYTVIRRLGRGGMGEVFLCRDTVLDLPVAVKFPRDPPGPRFLDEARNASRLNHPNIARIHHYDYEPGGRPFIVMEYVEGRCLSELIDQGPLAAERAVEIIDAVLAALEEAHQQGIIHRDIKPGNIMLTPAGEVKVLDFGLAKRIGAPEDWPSKEGLGPPEQAHCTAAGHAVGTARYMAPEQARGETDLDERCDIFAVGAVLFECLTGRPAFEQGEAGQLNAQAQQRGVPPPSTIVRTISQKLDDVVAKALAKSREGRYRSAAEMRAALPGKRFTRIVLAAMNEFARTSARSPARLSALAVLAAALYFTPRLYYVVSDLAERRPPEATRLFDAGLAAIRDGTYYSASRALDRAVSIDRRYSLARARLAESLFELEFTDRAHAELLRILGEGRLRGNNALLVEALRQTFSGNLEGAVSTYRQLARRTSGQEKAQSLVDLGRALERNNQSADALEQYRAAIALNPAYPAAFLRSGMLAGRLKGGREAESSLGRAESLYQALSNSEGQAEVWLQRGRLATAGRRTREALVALQRCLDLARSSGSAYQHIQAMLEISEVQALLAQRAEAETTAREAIVLARRAGIANLAARGQRTLGNVFLVAGEYDSAEPAFQEALDYARRHELRLSEARALFGLASVHSQRGRSALVLEEAGQAARFFTKGGFARDAGKCKQLEIRALRRMGRFEDALRAAEVQLQSAGPETDRSQVADLREVIASTLSVLERYPEALTTYRTVEQVARSLDDKIGIGFALTGAARLSMKLGDFDTARAQLKEAAGIAGTPTMGLKALLAVIASLEAELELERGRNREAAAKARNELQLSEGRHERVAIDSGLILAQALARSGSGQAAVQVARSTSAKAERYGEPYLRWRSSAVLAESLLAAGDAAGARDEAAHAAGSFFAGGQLESRWRTQAILAEALRRLGERERAAEAERQAKDLLERMRSEWPAGAFERYLARPDLAVRPYRRYTGKETEDARNRKPMAMARPHARGLHRAGAVALQE